MRIKHFSTYKNDNIDQMKVFKVTDRWKSGTFKQEKSAIQVIFWKLESQMPFLSQKS